LLTRNGVWPAVRLRVRPIPMSLTEKRPLGRVPRRDIDKGDSASGSLWHRERLAAKDIARRGGRTARGSADASGSGRSSGRYRM